MHNTVVHGAQASASRAEMGIVVSAIEKVCGAWIFGNYTEKSAHNLLLFKMIKIYVD